MEDELEKPNALEARRKELGTTSFKDILYLTHFPLINDQFIEHRVLSYFKISPFYNKNSNNDLLQEQSSKMLKTMTGLEYVVDLELSKPPHLFVIVLQNRLSAKQVEILDYYYIIDGSIYQAPSFLDVLRVRYGKVSLLLKKAYRYLISRDGPTADQDNDQTDNSEEKDSGSSLEDPLFSSFLEKKQRILAEIEEFQQAQPVKRFKSDVENAFSLTSSSSSSSSSAASVSSSTSSAVPTSASPSASGSTSVSLTHEATVEEPEENEEEFVFEAAEEDQEEGESDTFQINFGINQEEEEPQARDNFIMSLREKHEDEDEEEGGDRISFSFL